MEVERFSGSQALARGAAGRIVAAARRAVARSGRFSLFLAGGSTPRALYTLLAEEEWRQQIPWGQVQVYFGDERCVPPEHPDSNYRLARETLFNRVPLPPENIHRMTGEAGAERGAALYEQVLRQNFERSGGETLADVILLGMGEDGHTASLFPHSPALQVARRWVTPVPHDEPPPPLVDRISLTVEFINQAAEVLFLVQGDSKAGRLRQVLQPLPGQRPLPVQLVRPVHGSLAWLLDRAAASQLAAFPRS